VKRKERIRGTKRVLKLAMEGDGVANRFRKIVV